MNELVMYRLKSAKERLDSAKILLEAGKYKDSISRSYYYSPVGFVLAGLFSWLGKGMECGIGKDLRELNERYTKTRLESAWGRVNRVFEFK